ncbi:2-keto-4-pentenoate hydratase/2-oxohepta-3-ene-1,7-dioic acid hydratase in catechol pathway [Sphingopyxis panaciterrae]|uniref:fumarylacetoacetate hydrolase family protein n=1 Tax=Sphingopyxis panaciterrae TaxID=363841 RepID=UPI001423826D|nr:fumarylacetoacetate hydrolase family protein [Sphingopyxis panaciterrae]NIJ35941.1 2-keto-4-pentenoate hydratase/2-oxohepta-3-ene-1,7-dioic acid hydratase in catechol pathway [Sphingopyxis panaciterrae]
MRIACIGGRAWLVTASGKGADIEQASDGRFSADPQALFGCWGDLRAWAAGLADDALEPVDASLFELPVPRPRQIFAIGANYRAHAAEAGVAPPEQPVIFTKFPSCLTGPNDAVAIRHERVDWEVELVVVMAREARDVPAADAWDYVAGLAAGQDISERAIQRLGPMPQFSMAKSLPGFGPVGPVVVSVDEFANPDDLELGCAVNGETMQRSRTSDFIFPVGELIEYISHLVPIYPGDLIFTGTPEGVGATRQPPVFLKPGDVLATWVEGIGTLTNPITKEQAQ